MRPQQLFQLLPQGQSVLVDDGPGERLGDYSQWNAQPGAGEEFLPLIYLVIKWFFKLGKNLFGEKWTKNIFVHIVF